MTKAMDIDIVLGSRLRLIRESKNCSQKQLAQKIGVVFQQVQKYEVGINRMSCGRLIQILKALDISLYDFFADLNCNDCILVTKEERDLVQSYRHQDKNICQAILMLLSGEK